MDHILFARDGELVAGQTWAPANTGDLRGATIVCPTCCNLYSVGIGPDLHYHAIDSDGTVRPAWRCKGKDSEGRPCSFHAIVVLKGWVPRAKPYRH